MNATFKYRIIQRLYFIDYKMDVVQPFLHLLECSRMGDGALVLTVEVGFSVEFHKRFCPQEKLWREEFILVQKARMETQIAKNLAPEGIAPSRSPQVATLEEQPPPSPTKEG